VQAIIFLSARADPFWRVEQLRKQALPAIDTESLAQRSLRPGQAYLAVSSCLGYEAPYLREWIEFHRLMGVERFFLYNNGDREAQRQLLAPYVEEGLVVLHDWPQPSPQPSAFPHCLETHREDARWIAFIDADEFFFSPTGQELPEVLFDYEDWPAVTVSQVAFSMSGHRTRPSGLVIENYTTARPSPGKIKTVVDPLRVHCHAGPHRFICRGTPVDENKHPVYGDMTTYSSMTRLRINHYFMKSEAEYRVKTKRFRGATGKPYPTPDFARLRRAEKARGRVDHAILRYLPALRTRLREADEPLARL
jgi:glycosyl transferase family 92